jgi:hypothetical protein
MEGATRHGGAFHSFMRLGLGGARMANDRINVPASCHARLAEEQIRSEPIDRTKMRQKLPAAPGRLA